MQHDLEKLCFLGMGSPSDGKAYEGAKIHEKHGVVDFLHGSNIRIYYHPDLDKPFTPSSIHRTTQDAIKYAHMINEFANGGHKIAAVLVGGLALALPGVAAAEMPLVPTIGVPMDKNAIHNTYPIPDGTGEMTTGIGEIQTAIIQLRRILNHPDDPFVNIVADKGYKKLADVEGILDILKVRHQTYVAGKDTLEDNYRGITIFLPTLGSGLITQMKDRLEIGLCSPENNDAMQVDAMSKGNHNMLYAEKPINSAIFAARIFAAHHLHIARELVEYRKREAEKYPKMHMMKAADFR